MSTIKWRDWLPSRQAALKILFYVGAVYLLQIFVIPSFVTYLLDADFFAQESYEPASGEGEQAARLECNHYLQEKMSSERLEFLDNEDKVWQLGDGRYLVKGSAIATDASELAHKLQYACYVRYLGGEMFDLANWELKGLDWLAAQ
jgi:hypothetical protein